MTPAEFQRLQNNLFRPSVRPILMGPTASRPTATYIGQQYLDTTLAVAGKPISWNGTHWVDATGTIV